MYIRIHVCEYTARIFASNLSHRDRKPKYLSKFWTKDGGDGKRWPLTPFPFLAPWPSCPPAIETPPRPVPAGPLIPWPKNASCSRIPLWASRAFLQPRRWATPRHRLSLRPCTVPLSVAAYNTSLWNTWCAYPNNCGEDPPMASWMYVIRYVYI